LGSPHRRSVAAYVAAKGHLNEPFRPPKALTQIRPRDRDHEGRPKAVASARVEEIGTKRHRNEMDDRLHALSGRGA
jgi:hypothetical protein